MEIETKENIPSISAIKTTPNSLTVKWDSILESDPTYSYLIKYKPTSEIKSKILQRNHDENKIELTNLKPNTSYNVRVFVEPDDDEKQTIKRFELEERTKESPAKKLVDMSERLIDECNSNLPTYTLRSLQTISISNDVKRVILVEKETGTDRILKMEKTILLVGVTGSGKSTMVDALFNHLAGVCYSDDYRFKLTHETEKEKEKKSDQTKSQTETTTCYTLPAGSGLSTEHVLNIIDTPGFDDTDNKTFRESIVEQVHNLLDKTISELNAICIVIPSPSFRLTGPHKKVIEDIAKLFGKNVRGIMYCFATFNDGGNPRVKQTLEKEEISIEGYFVFSNGGLFEKHQTDNLSTDESAPAENETSTRPSIDAELQKWSINAAQVKKFLNEVYKSDGTSVNLTKEVLNAARNLQIQLQGLKNKVSIAAQSVINVKKDLKTFKERKEEIKLGKNFEYTIEVPIYVKQRTSKTLDALNCTKCKETCHQSCWAFWKLVYWTCQVFVSSKCTVCKNKCSPADHVRESAEYVLRYETKTNTSEDLQPLDTALQRLKQEVKNVESIIMKIKQLLKQLKDKALRFNDSSIEDYINNLSKDENLQKQPGFLDRIKFYALISNSHNKDLATEVWQDCVSDIGLCVKEKFDHFN